MYLHNSYCYTRDLACRYHPTRHKSRLWQIKQGEAYADLAQTHFKAVGGDIRILLVTRPLSMGKDLSLPLL